VPIVSMPFYLDWTFWAAILSLVAIILSQIPPIHLLIRPKRLDVEVHSRIGVTHTVGNPNANIVVGVRNTGGRELRIKSLRLIISRDGNTLMVLPAQNYHETPSSTSPVLFVPFSLKPGESWVHSVQFAKLFDRQTEKKFREDSSKLNLDIRQKIDALPEGEKEVVIAEPQYVQPFKILFERLFVWYPGEYIAELQVDADPGSASFSKKYRFTLYESDTEELRSHTDDYRIGAGIIFSVERHAPLSIPLSEHIG
jgi:hypothetical protein